MEVTSGLAPIIQHVCTYSGVSDVMQVSFHQDEFVVGIVNSSAFLLGVTEDRETMDQCWVGLC